MTKFPTDKSEGVQVLATGPIPSTKEIDHRFTLVEFSHDIEDVIAEHGASIRAIAAAGKRKIDADLIARLPGLEIIANFGVGYDRVDTEAAHRAGVMVTNTPDVLTEEVADLTLGLMISTVRQIPQADRFLREGAWGAGENFPLSPSLRNRRIGIVGLGRIGRAIARRCTAMELPVFYYGRSPQTDVDYEYISHIDQLAEAVDVLIVCVPGGEETCHLVNKLVLEKLGPDGVLINVARGSVVDEIALVQALGDGTILAAGLDVFADEPRVPGPLLEMPNTVLLPHVGSGTTVTREAMGDLVFRNIESWFTSGKAITPVL